MLALKLRIDLWLVTDLILRKNTAKFRISPVWTMLKVGARIRLQKLKRTLRISNSRATANSVFSEIQLLP